MNSPMYNNHPNVLMLGWELPPHNSGGLGVACYGLTKGLSQHGVPIAFALPRRLSVHVPHMKLLSHDIAGVEITALNSLLKAYASPEQYTTILEQISFEKRMQYAGNLYEEAWRFADMASAWATHQPHNIIHAHDWMTYPAAIRANNKSGQPWVAHIHATEYDRTGGSVNPQIAEIEYQGLQSADSVIAVSNYTKNIVNRYYGVPLDKIHVVHNGVDLVDFEPTNIKRMFPNDQIVLYVGRLTFQKGVDYFLKAAQEVLQVNPNTIFLVVGSGDMYQQLVMQAASLDIAHRVVFAGFLTGEKLRACYQMSDVFVMPSVSEPYGIVALEALASGTPAIISKQSGVSETLSHVLKVDFWDTHKMAEMISAVLRYPTMAQVLADQAKIEVQYQTWKRAAQKIIKVYQHTLE